MDFAKAISAEKKRIRSELASLNREKAQLEKKIAAAQKEMDAVLAYENAKKGSPLRKSSRRGRTKAPKVSVKSQILAVLKGKSMKPKDIKSALPSVKAQTVSNTLSALTQKGVLKRKDGEYSVA